MPLFSKDEIKFIKEAIDSLYKYVYDRGTFPDSVIWPNIQALVIKSGNIQEDNTELKRIQQDLDDLCEIFQIANIEKRKRAGKKIQEPMFFRIMHKQDQNPAVVVKHTGALGAAKAATDDLMEGLGSIRHDLGVLGDFAAREAKALGEKGVKNAKSSVNKFAGGVKKHVNTVAGVAKGGVIAAFDGTLMVGGAVLSAAEYIQQQVSEAIDKSILAMEMSVSNANLNDARVLLKNFQIGVNEVIDDSLQAAKNSIKALHADWDDDEITQEAKVLIDYDALQKELDGLNKMSLGVGEVEQRNLGISRVQNAINTVTKKVNNSLEASKQLFNEARSYITRDLHNEQQKEGWLSVAFKKFMSINDLEESIGRFKEIFKDNTDVSESIAQTKEQRETLLGQIQQMCDQAIALCKERGNLEYLEKLADADQQLVAILSYEKGTDNYEEDILLHLGSILKQIKEVDVLEKQRELNVVNQELEAAAQSLRNADNSREHTEKLAKKTLHALQSARSFVHGIVRLGHRGLNKIMFAVKKNINNIWRSITEMVKSTPTLAEKLVKYADIATQKISGVFDKFASKMFKIIGIKKLAENEDAIYQHQAFQPTKIQQLINERYIHGVNNIHIIDMNPNKNKPYPYNLRIELEFKDYSNGNRTIKQKVDVISFQKRKLDICSLPDAATLAKEGKILPPDQIRKFEEVQGKIMHILTHDSRGLSDMPRANKIKFVNFDDNHYLNLMLDSDVMKVHPNKFELKNSKASLECVERFNATITRQPGVVYDSLDVLSPGGIHFKI